MIQILIVDDQELVRTGLRHILEPQANIGTIAEASTGEEAVAMCRRFSPDCILLAVNLPGLTAFETTARLQRVRPEAGIVILAVHAKSPYPTRLLEAGARGYLTRDCDSGELIHAIRAVASGARYVGTEAAKQLALSMFPGRRQSPFEELSAREMEVLLKLTAGSRVSEIAALMCLSPKTIATYKYRIYDKLGTRSEVDLLRMAMRYGLLEAA